MLRPLTDRPFPNWGTINMRSIGAQARYHAFQAEVNRRLSGGLAFTTTYTLARNLADNGGPSCASFPGENACNRATDPNNRGLEYGDDYATRRHRSISTLAWDLPLGPGPALPLGRLAGSERLRQRLAACRDPALGVTKSVALAAGVKVEAGISFTNVLNHTNLADPNVNVTSRDFGVITSARGAELGGSRTGQFMLRVRF